LILQKNRNNLSKHFAPRCGECGEGVFIQFRGAYHAVHPEYHLLAWDAGWLQQYKMTQSQEALPAAKAALADDYAECKRRLRALGDQILAAAEADEMI
jgi:hypothetical protein